MAGFKTHFTTSTVLGMGYGTGALLFYNYPPSTCLLATGLCSLSGLLPDIDSESGIPMRESVAFVAAVVPIMAVDRLQSFGFSTEGVILVGGAIYIAIRYGLVEILRRYTVHRGMWHSLPAAMIAALIMFLLCSHDESIDWRIYKAGAVLLGFLSHLMLDELYSLNWTRGGLRVKKSFGTAMKLWGSSLWANVSTYGKLIFAAALVWGDICFHCVVKEHNFHGMAKEVIGRLLR